MPPPKHLTERQKAFARGVAVHGVALRAAKEAGYRHPKQMGMVLTRNPLVAKEIARIQAEIARLADPATIADAHEILTFQTRVMRGEEMEIELTLSGDPVERKGSLDTRSRAAMNLAKLLGLLTERHEHSGPGGRPIEVAPPSYREAMAGLVQMAREHPELAATIERATKGGA